MLRVYDLEATFQYSILLKFQLTILKHLHNVFLDHRQNEFSTKSTSHSVQSTLTSNCIAIHQQNLMYSTYSKYTRIIVHVIKPGLKTSKSRSLLNVCSKLWVKNPKVKRGRKANKIITIHCNLKNPMSASYFSRVSPFSFYMHKPLTG